MQDIKHHFISFYVIILVDSILFSELSIARTFGAEFVFEAVNILVTIEIANFMFNCIQQFNTPNFISN